MKKVAIITARGGSKRIPRKNIKSFLGQPIIAYSIKTALDSKLFDVVMVSTDDEEIAEIAVKYGAKVPFKRSENAANDYATTVEVLLEVLNDYAEIGEKFELGCCIYPTAPFITVENLQRGFALMQSKNFDTVFPVIPFSFPIQRAVRVDAEHKMQMFQPEHLATRSQDLEPAYHDSGQFYWFKTEAIANKRKLWTDRSGVLILSEMEAHDIDTPADWGLAELKFQLLNDE